MNNELLDALTILEKEKNISKETLLEAIENSLLTACKNHFGKADNVKVVIDPDTCEYHCYQEKTVVETVEDPIEQISLQNAQMINGKYTLGDIVQVEVKSKEFGRIATQNAKNVILQKIREEERKVIYDEYFSMEKEVVTGVVQRYVGRNVSVNLGHCDAMLMENEMIHTTVKGPDGRETVQVEKFEMTQRINRRIPDDLLRRKGEIPPVDQGGVRKQRVRRGGLRPPLRQREHAHRRHLGPRAAGRGHQNERHARRIPASVQIVRALLRVAHHERDRLGRVHGGTASDADDKIRPFGKSKLPRPHDRLNARIFLDLAEPD